VALRGDAMNVDAEDLRGLVVARDLKPRLGLGVAADDEEEAPVVIPNNNQTRPARLAASSP